MVVGAVGPVSSQSKLDDGTGQNVKRKYKSLSSWVSISPSKNMMGILEIPMFAKKTGELPPTLPAQAGSWQPPPLQNSSRPHLSISGLTSRCPSLFFKVQGHLPQRNVWRQ